MDKNNQNLQGQQFQIDLKPEVANGVYGNFAIISHSKTEFIVDLAALLQRDSQGKCCQPRHHGVRARFQILL